jgi:hypothetical protein
MYPLPTGLLSRLLALGNPPTANESLLETKLKKEIP